MKIYSPATNAFYAPEFRSDYEAAGTWPDDAIEVSAEIYAEMSTPPAGKIRIAGQDGMPVLIDKPAPTLQETIAAFSADIQQRLDAFAMTRNYDNILSACTYATSTVPKFRAEGQCCVDKRDATWTAAYAMLAEVEAGTIPVPTREQVMAALPVLEWPQ